MKSGIELITEERQKQIDKHGFTAEHHALNTDKWYGNNQLNYAVMYLIDEDYIFSPEAFPLNWDKEWFYRLNQKESKERLIIAGALIAAELDRLNYIGENNTEGRV
ncbi:MAG: hypothetical protein V4666_08365 [Bacteroidota bacterium]